MFLLVVDVIAPGQPIVDAYAFIPRSIRGILQKDADMMGYGSENVGKATGLM